MSGDIMCYSHKNIKYPRHSILLIIDNVGISYKTQKTPYNVDYPGAGGWFQPNQLVSIILYTLTNTLEMTGIVNCLTGEH